MQHWWHSWSNTCTNHPVIVHSHFHCLATLCSLFSCYLLSSSYSMYALSLSFFSLLIDVWCVCVVNYFCTKRESNIGISFYRRHGLDAQVAISLSKRQWWHLDKQASTCSLFILKTSLTWVIHQWLLQPEVTFTDSLLVCDVAQQTTLKRYDAWALMAPRIHSVVLTVCTSMFHVSPYINSYNRFYRLEPSCLLQQIIQVLNMAAVWQT